MTVILVSGYKNTDLGIFKDNDPRIVIIKKAIKRQLERYLDAGLQWLIFTGNLGFEYWVLEVAQELRKEYDFSMGTVFCFANQGENWNDSNREKLAAFKQVDFVKYSYEDYQNPTQFRCYNEFLVENSDGAYLFYSHEHETNLKYLYDKMVEKENYPIKILDFDELNEIFYEE